MKIKQKLYVIIARKQAENTIPTTKRASCDDNRNEATKPSEMAKHLMKCSFCMPKVFVVVVVVPVLLWALIVGIASIAVIVVLALLLYGYFSCWFSCLVYIFIYSCCVHCCCIIVGSLPAAAPLLRPRLAAGNWQLTAVNLAYHYCYDNWSNLFWGGISHFSFEGFSFLLLFGLLNFIVRG